MHSSWKGQTPTSSACPYRRRFVAPSSPGELIELYWQALARDIPFSRWARDETIAQAVTDLNPREDFRGPKIGASVTPQTLFRISAPGVLDGPYVSQFLLKPLPHGDLSMEQRYRVATTARNFAVLYKDWLALQNGVMAMESWNTRMFPATLPRSAD